MYLSTKSTNVDCVLTARYRVVGAVVAEVNYREKQKPALLEHASRGRSIPGRSNSKCKKALAQRLAA